jgi:hypothetical protein
MGLLCYRRIRRAQNSNKFCRFSLLPYVINTCLFIAGIFLFPANSAFGQDSLLERTISIPRQNTTVYEALNLVSEKADCMFIYESGTVDSDKKIRLHAESRPLRKVLDDILSNPGLEYRVIGKHILIYRPKQEVHPATRVQQALPPPDSVRTLLIRGHVYDRENKAAVPYASIGILEGNIGTVTNYEGFFTLKLPASMAGTSLVVSHLGYLSQSVPVQLLNEQQVDFYLDRRVISIQEVIIRYVDPAVIIRKAMEQRKVNNAVDPAYLTTFYREGVQKNNRYISYSEAVFRVYKAPYNAGEHSDQVKLLKSRKVQDPNPRDTVVLKLKAGVESALLLDIVKVTPGFLDQSPPVDYTYSYSDLLSYNSREAYAINFVQNPGLKDALYKGTVYIEKDGYAVLGADFEINPAYIDVAAQDLVLAKSHRLIVKLEKISYSVTYMPFNGRYYLGHVRCDILLKTRQRHHLFSDNFSTFLELATCSIDTANVTRFPKQETLRPGVVFSDQPYNPDEAFWGDLNIITPETKLNDEVLRMVGGIRD